MVSTPQEPSPLTDPDISTDDPLPPGGGAEPDPDEVLDAAEEDPS